MKTLIKIAFVLIISTSCTAIPKQPKHSDYDYSINLFMKDTNVMVIVKDLKGYTLDTIQFDSLQTYLINQNL